MRKQWGAVLAVIVLTACAREATSPVGVLDQDVAYATGGVTIVLPGDGHVARGITPSGWILGTKPGPEVVTWDPANDWMLATLASPAGVAEQPLNTQGDALIGIGSTGRISHVFLAQNGGGPFASAPGNPVARPSDALDGSWGAHGLNASLVLVGSAFIGPPYPVGMWYPMYWPLIDGGWPEARRLPGPPGMASAMVGAINDSGLAVGDIGLGSATSNTVVARAWMLHGSGAAMTVDTLPTLPWYPGAELMEATAVNNEGVIVGYYKRRSDAFPVAWLPSARFDYRYPSTPVVLPFRVNSGQNLPVNACGWVALASYGTKSNAVQSAVAWNVWTNEVVSLPQPNGSSASEPRHIADNGDLVGSARFPLTRKTNVTRPVLWRGYLPACQTAP